MPSLPLGAAGFRKDTDTLHAAYHSRKPRDKDIAGPLHCKKRPYNSFHTWHAILANPEVRDRCEVHMQLQIIKPELHPPLGRISVAR